MMKDKKKYYLARIEFDERISREDKLFGCLLFCGYPANQAYIIAYPSKASVNSAAALASRKVASWEVQAVLRAFKYLYERDAINFPHHNIKR